jgi:hypothetical protein
LPSRGSPNSALHTLHTLSTAHGTGRHRPEQVVVIDWNAWSSSIGTPGRHHPVRASRPNSLRSRNVRRCEEGGSNTRRVSLPHKQPRWSLVRQGKAIQHGERDTLGILEIVPKTFRPVADRCGDACVYCHNKTSSYALLKFANSSIFVSSTCVKPNRCPYLCCDLGDGHSNYFFGPDNLGDAE